MMGPGAAQDPKVQIADVPSRMIAYPRGALRFSWQDRFCGTFGMGCGLLIHRHRQGTTTPKLRAVIQASTELALGVVKTPWHDAAKDLEIAKVLLCACFAPSRTALPRHPQSQAIRKRHDRTLQQPDRGRRAKPRFPFGRGIGNQAAMPCAALQPAAAAISPRQQDTLAGDEAPGTTCTQTRSGRSHTA